MKTVCRSGLDGEKAAVPVRDRVRTADGAEGTTPFAAHPQGCAVFFICGRWNRNPGGILKHSSNMDCNVHMNDRAIRRFISSRCGTRLLALSRFSRREVASVE